MLIKHCHGLQYSFIEATWSIDEMSAIHIKSNQEKLTSLPSTMEAWLPYDNLAQFVVEIVEQLNFRSFRELHAGDDQQPYSPAMLTALLFYGYATGVFSSRELEHSTYDSVNFQYISANTHPDHDTITNFRRRFSKELSELFVQILMIASLMDVPTLSKISLDGGKTKAGISRQKDSSFGYAHELEAQIKAEVDKLLRKAEAADRADISN